MVTKTCSYNLHYSRHGNHIIIVTFSTNHLLDTHCAYKNMCVYMHKINLDQNCANVYLHVTIYN